MVAEVIECFLIVTPILLYLYPEPQKHMLGKHVFLGLWVKVKENWRNNKEALYYFGYHVE